MVRMVVILFTIHYSLFTASAQQLHEYTDEHPLVMVCDWEFPPYEFSNNRGEPDGYNIDLMRLIFERLGIPYRFVMQEWYQAIETFEKREADIIHALSMNYKQRPYVMTRNVAHFYRIKCVRRPSTPPISHISRLGKNDTITVKNNDYAPYQILLNDPTPRFTMEYHSPREAMLGVRSGKYKYFIWGERPIGWKMREYGVDSLLVSDDIFDIPPGELRIIGYDKELIDQIDDEYARLEQAGEIERLRDKWFHPEREHNDSSPVSLFVIIGAIILILIGFVLSRLIRSRVRAATRKTIDLNNMMTQALGMGDYHVIECGVDSDRLTNVYGDLLPGKEMTRDEFISRILDWQQPVFCEAIEELKKKGVKNDIKIRWNVATPEAPDWHYLHGNAIIEAEEGKPAYMVFSLKDVTKEILAERLITEMGEKYFKMFKTNLIAMSFYGPDGYLIDLNDKMRALSGFDEQGERYFRTVCLFDMPLLKEDFDHVSEFHVCQRMYYPEIGLDKYIEFRVKPIVSDEGSIRYYSVTARDISDERIMYLEQLRHDREMRLVADESNAYETQLHYLLENSNMYVWRSSLKEGTIHFSRSLRTMEHAMTLADYVSCMDPDEQSDSKDSMASEEIMSKPFNVIHHFSRLPFQQEPAWFAISGMPISDKKGNCIGQFGVMRNITDLMEAQQKLKEETARAEDSGRMKSAFLANMTHEIRTPLNAIVGFSDLLPVIDEPSERMEFIRIIRNNCDMLLRLINDILEASSMGQALAIEPEEVDFAQVFDDICQTLAQRVQEPGVEFIKDNPYASYRTVLDKGRVQQVLTNFTTNAVKYTHEGHIKVGYHAEARALNGGEARNGLYFYCEDTGAGIPKEKQPKVFERFVKLNDFVQGTGLGLSICQSIADRCEGEIGVTSEGEGHGSTFWLWIPCEQLPSSPGDIPS